MTQEKFTFQAEVSRLLDIVAHSLYSHKEIFLRELISNASDACDKLRYLSLTRPDLGPGEGGFRIELSVDAKKKTLSIADNGIGMNHQDLLDTLGTIARSGTQAFIDGLSGDERKDVDLIGRFGVGFYSSFMVSEKVEVLTRKAGEDEAWLWTSDGRGEFTIDEATRDAAGTTVTLTLRKDDKEYLEEPRIGRIVKTYSDHIGIPILLMPAKEGEEPRTLNAASALWTRPAKEITPEQYKEFYHHVGHGFDDPWMTLHGKAEGVLSYTHLLFVPSSKPFDLFDPERKPKVKLYVNRVFITDDCEGLVPSWLRFLRGVVDSEDLSLNISREMLQKDPKLAKIKAGLTKKVLGELKKKAENDANDYAGFWDTFGAVLKEGLYEDFENREKLLPLVRFRHTAAEGLVSLDAYVDGMKEGQEAIYYITGQDADQLARSPQLEGFRKKGVDVLLLADPVDEFWIPAVGTYKDKPFHSVTRGGVDLGKIQGGDETAEENKEEAAPAEDLGALLLAFKEALGEAVKDVRSSERLTDSPVCLVADEGGLDMHLERILKQHKRLDELSPRILEINPRHALIRGLAAKARAGGPALADAAHLLLDQARILEGETVPDPQAFARRMAAAMEKGL
jgi:molecular chaperone HtpG